MARLGAMNLPCCLPISRRLRIRESGTAYSQYAVRALCRRFPGSVCHCKYGIALYPSDGKDIDTLLINADVAMYQAKHHGRNNYQFFSAPMNNFAVKRFTIENKLRKALDHNEFMLFYQPQIDISTGRMIGAEALIRWLQPDLVLVKAGEFIPLAEETGLIIPIGEWVLRNACSESKAWQKAVLSRFW